MKNVFTIFIQDLKALSKRFFAMAIVIAICFIPALYAWFNIFANWDPYGSTGNIPIAVASDDLGYTDQDGVYVNKGEEVLQQLAQKDTIHFIVYDDSWEALEAMESGECYAAIIFEKYFTQNMYDLASALTYEDDTITFYENYKLNPVANKITESAASTVSNTVQTEYLEVLFDTIFGKLSDIVDAEDVESSGNKVVDVITKLRNTTASVSTMIGSFTSTSSGFAEALAGVSTGDAASLVIDADTGIKDANSRLYKVQSAYDDLDKKLGDDLDKIISILEGNSSSPSTASENQVQLTSLMGSVDGTLNSVNTIVNDSSSQQAVSLLADAQANITNANELAHEPYNETQAYQTELYKDAIEDIKTINKLRPLLTASVDQYFATMENLTANLDPVLLALAQAVTDVDPTMQAASETVYALNDTMGYVQNLMDSLTKKLDDLLDKVETLQDSDTVNGLIDMLGGDSEKFAEFFACPVTVETEALFPVSTYGTAMAPFYSTLAIWVGCVVLVAVIKTEAEPRKVKNVTVNQLYWARFILMLLLNEIQTIVIVTGDLLLLGIGCQDPGGLYFAAIVTSFVFVAFIYSMVISFGDIGKAIVVVIMVLEIAGSSGTYPIEILQEQFITLYKMFPFPYAINAMREAICGYYMMDYWIYLGELMIFGVIGIVIGIFVRHPFIKMNEYIEEEMEDSGVL